MSVGGRDEDTSGPPLRDYLETRLNLLTVAIEKQQIATDLRYQQRFDAAEKAVQAALSAADRAVSKAELASEKRFEGVNEFRNTLSDQQRTLIPRQEVDVLMQAMNEKIGQLQAANIARQAESTGVKGGWGYAVGVFGFVMTILAMVTLYLSKVRP